jgi:hypothetical protein
LVEEPGPTITSLHGNWPNTSTAIRSPHWTEVQSLDIALLDEFFAAWARDQRADSRLSDEALLALARAKALASW